ncbi:MAG TPA: beta-propeller domain-containing protein [Steroidobacteraceae bacterium]|nr:beta-propeller domain-containing protein [Steroidobacteraceae bacterium]
MRRPLNWLVFSLSLLFLFANLLLAGCGGGGSDGGDGGIDPPSVSGMLRKVSSPDELESSLKSSLRDAVAAAGPSGPVAPPSVVAGGDASFSNTYTSEAGVDEFDYARYDGTHLYVAPTPFANTLLPRAIRILRTDPLSGAATQVSSIPIEGDQQVQGLYVANGRMVMLTSGANYSPYGGVWIAVFHWAPTDLAIHVFDVNDPARPAKMLHAELDGVFVASRRIGDRVYLVSRHTPSVVLEPLASARISAMTLAELLPKITIGGSARSLVTASDCYVTNEPNHKGYPILTTITSFSMQDPGDLVNTCYNEESNGVYASTTALYVSQPVTAPASLTRIHKFSFTGAAPAYAGSVEVPGLLWMGGQQDFRMSEYQGMLRVVTSVDTSDPADWQDYRLFVLRPRSSELALEVVSSLPNDARPEELGKPNEGLFAVRFAGDRAYAVTFRQVDPLYVLDLANPADPRIAGQLEIPGFSTFLHPVTQNLLLGLGSEAGRAKLELFDVSVLEQPQSRGSVELGGWHSSSEAMYDRHAFTYLPAETADRFAIPATITTGLPNGDIGIAQSSLHQFEILGKQTAASASLQAAGVVTPPAANDVERFATSSRSFIHGETVYYVRDGNVWSTSWFTPSQVQGPF